MNIRKIGRNVLNVSKYTVAGATLGAGLFFGGQALAEEPKDVVEQPDAYVEVQSEVQPEQRDLYDTQTAEVAAPLEVTVTPEVTNYETQSAPEVVAPLDVQTPDVATPLEVAVTPDTPSPSFSWGDLLNVNGQTVMQTPTVEPVAETNPVDYKGTTPAVADPDVAIVNPAEPVLEPQSPIPVNEDGTAYKLGQKPVVADTVAGPNAVDYKGTTPVVEPAVADNPVAPLEEKVAEVKTETPSHAGKFSVSGCEKGQEAYLVATEDGSNLKAECKTPKKKGPRCVEQYEGNGRCIEPVLAESHNVLTPAVKGLCPGTTLCYDSSEVDNLGEQIALVARVSEDNRTYIHQLDESVSQNGQNLSELSEVVDQNEQIIDELDTAVDKNSRGIGSLDKKVSDQYKVKSTDKNNVEVNLNLRGTVSAGIGADSDSIAVYIEPELSVGGTFGEHFGLFGYVNGNIPAYDPSETDNHENDLGIMTENVDTETNTSRRAGAGLMARVPVADGAVTPYAKVGAAFMQTEASKDISRNGEEIDALSDNYNGVGLEGALGIDFDFGQPGGIVLGLEGRANSFGGGYGAGSGMLGYTFK